MQDAERYRHHGDQSCDAKANLDRYGQCHDVAGAAQAFGVRGPAASPPKPDDKDCDEISADTMIELYGRRILEKVAPPRCSNPDLVWHPRSVHQWEGVVVTAGIKTGDQGARNCLKICQQNCSPSQSPLHLTVRGTDLRIELLPGEP